MVSAIEECPICRGRRNDGQPTVVLREKGNDSIKRARESMGGGVHTVPGQDVHIHCCRDYIYLRNITNSKNDSNSIILHKFCIKQNV